MSQLTQAYSPIDFSMKVSSIITKEWLHLETLDRFLLIIIINGSGERTSAGWCVFYLKICSVLPPNLSTRCWLNKCDKKTHTQTRCRQKERRWSLQTWTERRWSKFNSTVFPEVMQCCRHSWWNRRLEFWPWLECDESSPGRIIKIKLKLFSSYCSLHR